MATFGFFSDIGLVNPIVSAVQFPAGVTTTVVYLGSTDDTKKLQDATNPGVTSVEVSIVDSTPGSGAESTWVKLAASYGGLSGATPGASLDVGVTVYGGSANCVPVYAEISNSLSGSTSSTELSLKVQNVKEFAV